MNAQSGFSSMKFKFSWNEIQMMNMQVRDMYSNMGGKTHKTKVKHRHFKTSL